MIQNISSSYDIEAAIIYNLVIFPRYRKEIFELCQDIDFGIEARPVFQQLFKAYNDNIIDTMIFKTQFLSNWNEKLKEGKGKCWPEVKHDFFDRALRRKGHWESELLGTLFNDPLTPIRDIQDRLKLLNEIVNDARISKRPIISLKNVMAETMDNLQRKINDQFEYISWGIPLLDFHCQIEAQDLCIIAARPGLGKTVAAHNCILGAAGQANAYWVGEMSNSSVGQRLLSILTGINHNILRNPKKLTSGELLTLFEAVKKASDRNIYVSTNVGETVEEIGIWIKQLVEYKGIKHVFIDYLQRIQPTNPRAFRRDQVQHISNTLKNIAAEHNICITALAQLNRESVGERPQISHLAECSHLEQDASTIILIDRIESGETLAKRNYKYRVPGSERVEDCTIGQLKDTMIMLVAKSRHAQRKTLYLDCDLSTFTIHGEKKFCDGDFSNRNQNINKQKGK